MLSPPDENPLARDLDHVLSHTEALWQSARGQRFFITGGTGFVGAWLVESLLWANRRLNLGISAVLLTRNPGAFHSRSPHLADDRAITLLSGDAAAFEFPDGNFPVVVHAATERYVAPSIELPASTLDRDLAATRRVLELARSRGARHFLLTSSGAVYGRQPAALTHIPEDYAGAPPATDPASAYGQGKRISEFLCATYSQVYGFPAAIARMFTFVGPHLPLDQNYAVGNFIRDAMAGGPVQIAGDGTTYRSYLYGADLAIWLWTILFRGKTAYPYNVGSADAVTIADLARRVVSVIAPTAAVRIARQPEPGAPPLRYVPATERAEKELGLRPWISLEEGIRRTWDWQCKIAPRTTT